MSNTTVSLVGNITADPVLKFTNAGTAVLNFSVAVNEGENKTSFYDVTAWKGLAESAANTLTKGMRVVVVGMLSQSSWETKEGEKRNKVQVTADAIGPELRFASAAVQKNTNGTRETPQSDGERFNGVQSIRDSLAQTFPGSEELTAADAGNYNGEPF